VQIVYNQYFLKNIMVCHRSQHSPINPLSAKESTRTTSDSETTRVNHSLAVAVPTGKFSKNCVFERGGNLLQNGI